MKTYIIILLAALLFVMPSCKKILNEKQNSKQAELNSVATCQAALDNTFLNTTFPSEAEVYADDYYILDARYNALPSDELRNIYAYAPNAVRSEGNFQWTGAYRRVYILNVVLEALDKIEPGSAAYNQARGIALFFRAFNFYHLVSIYAKAYDAATASQDPGIPIRLKSDISLPSERSSVQQSYDQIIKDLNEAAALLPVTTNIIATRPVKAAAYAMLARVYLSMRDYPNALAAANSALQLNNQLVDYNTLDVNTDQPFNFTNKEALFHADVMGDYLLSTSTKASLQVYASYDDNDLRKKIFFKSNGDGTYRFTGNYGPSINAENTTGIVNPGYGATRGEWAGLATDEVYLIRAECYARAGNIALAMADLNALLSKRYVTGTYTDKIAATADAALTVILNERRKELIFRGIRWTDLKRLNKDPQREVTITRIINGVTYTLPPNDLRYQILIPLDVINNSSLIQNPR